MHSLLSGEEGRTTVRVQTRPGRITMAGHVLTIVRNVVSDEASNRVRRVTLLAEPETSVCTSIL